MTPSTTISTANLALSPWQQYQRSLECENFSHDPAQEQAVRLLQGLYERLLARQSQPKSFMSRLMGRFSQPQPPEQGLYMWGGVGRGKTYLMDMFYQCLPGERKLRVHFHRFMQRVQAELTELEGSKNPLLIIADKLATEIDVICFDEFFVTDIADAMILGGLFEALFERGITLVATSNIVPERLYENGLQRQRFLPAIALLEKHTLVVNVDAGTDYRLRTLEQAELYHYPLDDSAEKNLCCYFEQLAQTGNKAEQAENVSDIEVNGRNLQVRKLVDDVVWFDFVELCGGPRSQNDYIELARVFHTVLLSAVPGMQDEQNDEARRFINLVDEFYDRNVKLVTTAEVALDELYQGTQLAFEFQRTRSRLLEMQSREYLAREHRP